MRLNRLIGISGIASRREADKLIIHGKVMVNNQIVQNVVTFIQNDDIVHVNGQNISQWLNKKFVQSQLKLWIFYKPKGVICSRKDTKNRTTLFSILPISNVISVGRLDYNTEGLILLTNNGQLARYFELPSNCIKRIYRCKVFGEQISDQNLNTIRNGITIDGILYQNIDIVKNQNNWFTITLREGKNREIRKIFEYFDLKVSRLIRVQYGEFCLKNLKRNDLIEVSTNVLQKYKKFLHL